MNTKQNQRFIETDHRIKATFLNLLKEKSIEQITISELCANAKINRASFYLHYDGLEDMLTKMEEDNAAIIMGFFKTDDLKGAFVKLFEYIRERRVFYSCLANFGKERYLFRFIIPTSFSSAALQQVAQKVNHQEYHLVFFRAGLTAITMKWIRNGYAESPEEMARIVTQEYSIIDSYRERKAQNGK